jgi:hypothetical protein
MAWDVSCPDGAITHGPADGRGRCPWCGRKVTSAMPAPRAYPVSDLTEAYDEFYDPDYGATGRIERERLFRAGQVHY